MATPVGNLYPFSGGVTKIRTPGWNQSNMGLQKTRYPQNQCRRLM